MTHRTLQQAFMRTCQSEREKAITHRFLCRRQTVQGTTLWNGDCLELMKNIPDGSVDLVLTDPPYGTMKGAALDGWKNQTTQWDTAIDPVKIFEQIGRVLMQNGKAILFSQ